MTPREERGLIIAALCKLKWNGEGWLVPSQTGNECIYRVDPRKQTCTCPDHQEAGHKCKHLFAVEFTIKREQNGDGTVSETRSVTFAEKVTYTQNWPAYNLAQTTEKHRFQELLADLSRSVPQPPRPPGKAGRPSVLLSDAVFAATFKIYSTFGCRRFACDLKDAQARGHVTASIHYNSVCAYLENPALTPLLSDLIARSAWPLRSVETDFAIDSSGFSSSKFIRWFDHKYGVTRQKHAWVKVHLVSGVKTNVVTAVRILDKDAADSPQLAPLAKKTAETFRIGEFSADKAYLSKANLELIDSLGGTLYVPFKTTSGPGKPGSLWDKLYGYYRFKQDEFLAHYHKRSNVESTFSAIKRVFGDSVRSKTDVAMVNEVLGKVLCHNIRCVIHSQYELGIEPVFWPEESDQPSVREEILSLERCAR